MKEHSIFSLHDSIIFIYVYININIYRESYTFRERKGVFRERGNGGNRGRREWRRGGVRVNLDDGEGGGG